MAPGIPTGSIVAVRPVPVSDMKVGDVITFTNPSTPDVLVTHRVVSLDVPDGQTMLITKGDANDAVDGFAVPANRAVGRVDFALPWLGEVMVWLGSPMVKIASVCLAILALGLSVASVQRPTDSGANAQE
jgi:signal peptidase